MTNAIEVFAKLISTTQAAYADFLANSLLDGLKSNAGSFTDTEAQEFVDRYDFIHQQLDTGTGFSASVFQDTQTGKLVFAVRGTQASTFGDLGSDLFDIGTTGFANKQTVDMYRYWKKLTTDMGQPVVYSNEEVLKLYHLNNGSTDDGLGVLAHAQALFEFKQKLNIDTGILSNPIPQYMKMDVTGHSLGGNLAYIFSKIFPENVSQVVTINAPGISGGEVFLNELGFTGSVPITSINAEKDPIHNIAGAQPGRVVEIGQEVSNSFVTGHIYNHSVVNAVDSLNLMALFAELDPTQANNPPGLLKTIMQQSSYQGLDTYERMLDGLRGMLIGEDIQLTPASAKDDIAGREQLYLNMKSLEENQSFTKLKGRVTFVLTSTNASKAKSDYGQFLALYYATSFALKGNNGLINSLNPSLYSAWMEDQFLSVEERKNGKANFSDEWYQDRIALLKGLTSRNVEDEVNDTKTNIKNNDILYTDENSSLTLLSEGKSGGETNLIKFGDEKVNDLTGGVSDDHIYGMAGNDKLNGQKGNDILFGGAGEDQLNGGEGADLLFGGSDKDTLDGGEGNDILKGGEGDDTYKFTGNFGRDVIFDTEGSNSLDINGIVSSFTQLAKDSIIYYDDINNPTRKAVLVDEGNTKSLIISTVSKSGLAITDSGNSVTIKNWNGTGFGISLNEAVVLPPDTEKVFTVTANNNDNALSLDNAQDTDSNYGVIGYKTIKAEGKAGNDLIMGLSTGKDTLLGGDGNDVISSGFTDSVVSSSHMQVLDVPGIDSISGGKGEDYIVASALAVAHGDDDNDVLRSDVALYAVIPGENRDVIWKDIQQFMNYIPEKKETSGVIEYVTGLTFKKNLTAEFQEFASVNGSKFIAKYADGKTTIAYNYSYANGSYIYDSPRLVDIVESNIVPTNGNYDAIGKMQGASLFGDAGDDYLFGGDRSDYLSGGDGKDTIFGGEGQDVIDGGKESDLILGSEGDDLVIGGEGDDTIFGSKGGARAEASDNDVLYGGSGADKIYGGMGRDYIDGGIGLDELRGGDGDDYLYGGDDQEKDFLYGGADNDTIVMGLHDQADGGSGNNIYIWDPYQVTSINTQSADLSGFDNAASDDGVFGDIFGDATNTSTTPRIISDAIYIKNTEGNNTLGIAGVSSLNDAAINISGDYLLISSSGNQELVIEGGVSNTPVQIRFGSTVEQLSNTPIVFSPLTDEHFLNGLAPLEQDQITSADLMLAKLETIAVLTGNANQYLVGGLNNDTLTANLSGSTIIGGKGNDNLIGDVGNDTYLIRKDDGNDTLVEKGGANHIKFDRNISVAQTTVRRNGTDLVFTFSEDQHFTVKNMFNAQGALIAANSIKDVTFYTGALGSEVWDLTRLKQQALASTAADDIITGFDGDDIYYYSLGGGRDVITDAQGNDTIQLGEGIKKDQVIVRKDVNNNLILSFRDGGSVTVVNAFNSSGEFTGNVIESIKFADNSIWNLTQLQSEVLKDQAQTFNGTDHDEVLTGSAAKDVLVGNKGNDRLVGGAANDIYQYALGDGNDLIVDTNGIDSIRFTNVTQSDVIARSNGKDLTLTLSDGAVLTVKDMFVTKIPNVVDPLITSILSQIETRWISQAETLIENHFGLVGSGDLELNFGRNITGGHVANISFKTSTDGLSLVPVLTIDLEDFAELPNGSAPYYYDRLITHEMTHAVMARNMDIGTLPGWFLEGTAEFIQGADERVKSDLNLINSQSNFEALFKTTLGSPSTSAGYSVSYIAVKFLDNEIRKNGGIGIREVFDQLKIGKTLSQSLAIVSSAHGGMGGMWSTLSTFEAYFKAVGFSSFDSLLSLNNSDTGSIAGSDYGNAPLDAKAIVADTNSGSSKHFNLVIPTQFIAVGDEHNEIETIQFLDGSIWNMERIQQEITKGNLIATDRNDFIVGTQGDDNLQGYKGDDHLSGGLGNDVYSYTLGDGKDFIVDAAGINELQLSGIAGNQVKTTRDSSNNLVLTFADGGAITIADAFNSYGILKSDHITTVRFADGSVWDSTRIRQESLRMPGATLTAPAHGIFSGTDRDDTLVAGINNKLSGLFGNDTFLINAGGEHYVIEDNYGANTLQFGAGITKDQLRFTRDWIGTDLHISVNGQDYVSVKYMFSGVYTTGQYANNYPTPAIEYIRFENGEQLSLQDIKRELLLPTDSDDTLYGDETNDVIVGQAGDDTIRGFSGHDVLSGGSGNDSLYGGEGNDVYYYRNGDGNDQIQDDSGVDEIAFGEGILPEDVSLYRQDGFGLKVVLKDGSTILIKNMFNVSDDVGINAIERIRFSNDTFWDLEKIKAKIIEDSITEGNDIVEGFASSDVIEAGGGYDQLRGKGGDDRYIFNRGDGVDIITDTGGNDTLVFGSGIAPTDVVVHHSNGNFYFIINNGEMVQVTGSIVDGTPAEATLLERVEFAGGVVWDRTIIQQKINETLANPNLLMGRSSWDRLYPGNNNSIVNGLDGYDQIYGGDGNDTLIGGSGLNFLDGGAGDDTYLITEQPAINFIEQFRNGFDRILFAEGISPDDVTVKLIPGRQEGYVENGELWVYSFSKANDWNFEIKVGDTIVYLDSLLSSGALFGAKVKDPLLPSGKVEFFNGTQWTVNDLLQQAVKGTAADDDITGSGNNDVINGLTGNDLIRALDGADTVDGGEGNDTLIGGYGNDILIGGKGNDLLRGDNSSSESSNLPGSIDDVYRFNRGDGNDTIEEYFGRDTIEFGAGITKEQVVLSTVGDDTLVSFLNSSDTITIKYGALPETEFYAGGKIEIFKFANGDEWNFDPRAIPVFKEGGEGSDTLTGGYGKDTLIGHGGNDYLLGDLGDDSYHYNLGDGFDRITDVGGVDQIIFGNTITPDMVKIRSTSNEALIISINGVDALSYNENVFQTNPDVVLEKIVFSSVNVAWDQATIFSKALQSTSGDDEIYGSLSDELVDGGAGNDRLETRAGNDTLIGNTGNDYLFGGTGDDVYRFNLGDGSDSILDEGGYDTIEFLADILPTDISVQRTETDLILKVKNANPITLSKFFNDDDNRAVNELSAIENIIFANGESWSRAQLLAKLSNTGTSSANTLYGSEVSELIDAKEGNDSLFAGGGNDTLIGGSGNDNLYGEVGDDLLQGGDGDDWLSDEYGSNIYVGGKGNDSISLSYPAIKQFAGPGTIRFGLGDGIDEIYSPTSHPVTIELGVGITPDMLAFETYFVDKTKGWSTGNEDRIDLLIIGSSDRINKLLNNGAAYTVKFSDGTFWTAAQLNDAAKKSMAMLSENRRFLTGNAHPNSRIYISYLNQNNTVTEYPVIQTDATGHYEFDFGFGIKDVSRIIISGKDLNGNTLPITAFGPSIDTSIPPSPTVELDSSGYVLTGFARPGTYVSASTPERHIGGASSDLITGAFTIVAPTRLNNGEKISVTASGSAPKIISTTDVIAPLTPSGVFDNLGTSLSGSAEKGSTLSVTNLSGTLLGTSAANSDTGAYAINFTQPIANGELIKLVARDAAGNSSMRYVRARDLTAPTTVYASIDKTGKIIKGFAEPGATVIIRDTQGGLLQGALASVIDGAFEVILGNALAASQVVNVKIIDTAGNASAVIPIIAGSSNTPTQPQVAIDSQGRVVSGVSIDAGTIIVRTRDNVELARTTVQAGGAFNITLANSYVNQEILSVSLQKAGGVESAPNYFIAPDKTAPAQPFAAFSDYNSEITGYAEPLSTVEILKEDNTVVASITANGKDGSFVIRPEFAISQSTRFSVVAIDRNGNASSALALIPNDRFAPVAPTASFNGAGKVVSGTAESGTLVFVEGGYWHSSNRPVIGFTRADQNGHWSIELAEAIIDGSAVNIISVDAGNNRSVVSIVSPDLTVPLPATAQFDSTGKIITGTAEWTESGGNQVMVMDSTNTAVLGSVVMGSYVETYKITLSTALKNNELVNIIVKDVAGNVSAITRINAPDKTAPVAPSAAFDTTGQIINGIAEAGSTVIVKNTSGSQLGTAVANGTTGAYTITLSTALINKQTVNVTAKDAAGNTSSTRAIVAPDLTAPTAPSASIDTTGKIITGTAENGSTVIIKNAAGTELKTGVANASTGAYSITLTTAMINKESLSVTARDSAGNISPVRVIVAPDKTAPAIPTAAFDTAGKVITGVAEAGSTVSVKNAAGTELKTATANTSTGAYTITLTTALINKETVNVTAKDAAGNISAIKSLIAPDKTPPAAPTASLDATRKIITGNAEAGSVVEVKNASNQSLGSVTANATTGVYTISLNAALAVNQVVSVTAKDAAGNISPVKSITALAAAKAAFADIGYENLQMGPHRLFGLLAQSDSSNTQSGQGNNIPDSWFGSPSERVTHNLIAHDQPIKPHVQQLGSLIQSMAAFAPSAGVEGHLSERGVNYSSQLLAVGS